MNLKRAMAQSCDVYFYEVGRRLGIDRLAKYSRLLGFGSITGVEMEHEKPGIVPSTAWKMKTKKQKWHEGETISVAIGQGYNLVTPLQLTVMTAAIANGGILYRPTLVEREFNPDGSVAREFKPEVLHRFTDQNKNLQLIREAMVGVVNGGTGRRGGVPGVLVGGKTGTAQVVRLAKYKHLREGAIPYKYRDHAWFTSFAPANNPEIAVSVLVEHGLHGGSVSAPIASRLMSRYFQLKHAAPPPKSAPPGEGGEAQAAQNQEGAEAAPAVVTQTESKPKPKKPKRSKKPAEKKKKAAAASAADSAEPVSIATARTAGLRRSASAEPAAAAKKPERKPERKPAARPRPDTNRSSSPPVRSTGAPVRVQPM